MLFIQGSERALETFINPTNTPLPLKVEQYNCTYSTSWKMRHQEDKKFVQGYTLSQWQSQECYQGLLIPIPLIIPGDNPAQMSFL